MYLADLTESKIRLERTLAAKTPKRSRQKVERLRLVVCDGGRGLNTVSFSLDAVSNAARRALVSVLDISQSALMSRLDLANLPPGKRGAIRPTITLQWV
jgi:hypothetical protein